jgi:RNA helicase
MSQKEKGDCNKRRWAEILELVEEGNWEKMKEYLHEYCVHLHKLKLVHSQRTIELNVLDHSSKSHFWYYGPPGSGKSLRARTETPKAYIRDPKTKWWNGYDGHEEVIIDDFDKYQVAHGGDMKRLLDI